MNEKTRVINKIQKQIKDFVVPVVTVFARSQNPYLVLISCLLSLRTKDKTTVEASNRLGWVKTKNPEQTEIELGKIIPKDYWIELNTALVTFGQNICLPVSPYCGKCHIGDYCKKIGVARHR
ncbi:MAG: hypothetical protein NTY14_05890 [Candidatus Omnitrophica bacterium]|nr:hypothetical protein [Candidatus Omnitrophota bacterium]